MDIDLELMRARYEVLIDPEAEAVAASIDVDGAEAAEAVRVRLQQRFSAEPDLDRVAIYSSGHLVGVATRGAVEAAGGRAAPADPTAPSGVGDSDRARLPGNSTQYRALRYICNSCKTEEFRSFHDERYLPDCKGHGRMELCG